MTLFRRLPWVLSAALLAPGAARCAPPVYTVADGACPWHDRRGQWVVADVPERFRGGTVWTQACGERSLVLPDGTRAAVIAISAPDRERVTAQVPSLKETGLSLKVKNPAGTAVLPYVVLEYPAPPVRTDFIKVTNAGVVLLSTDPPLPAPPDGQPPAVPAPAKEVSVSTPAPAPSGRILAAEQTVEGQEWPFAPGKREFRIHVEEPAAGVGPKTGIMLVLHNWGGVYDTREYVAWSRTFADRYDTVAVSVNYLQSGQDRGGAPYDHGYLQAMDAIRAVHAVWSQLKAKSVPFDEGRVYAMGGSGGGNVSQMAAKLAPRTFACIVDICGMPGLTDGIAFGTKEYGSSLNAGYSRDPASPAFLAPHMQEIRDFGNPAHCAIVRSLNPDLKIVIAHGVDDRACPVVHKITQFRNMVAAGMDVDGRFLTKADVDGKAVTTTGHPVGNREQVVIKYADVYLSPAGTLAKRSTVGPDLGKPPVVYPVTGGRYVVDYAGPPTIRFEPAK